MWKIIQKILMENKKWAPSQEEKIGIITNVYESIKEKLSEL
ncbi:putative DDT domain [Prochlorococcus marinus str. MIT 9302]|uniref:Putative DDT domain n=1 Tax=Prochlorococcus marinus str. MIT 9302 TaxID=74545 RepID=A0A0A2A906_PROMR|nr:putative DDT domain [Prochlorococcus marinus str. MIT 9302]